MDSITRAAIFVFVALWAALLVWMIVSWRRYPNYTFFQWSLYLVNRFFTRVLWRTQVSGPLPIAPDQGAVIVCNHTSGVDPLFIQLCTNRIVHWMVAREYYYNWAMTFVFRSLRSIPVNRGGIDTAATKMAIRLAHNGGLVGLFPEGRVNVTSDLLLPGRPGAALIALKAQVPVIPCYVSGAPYDGTALGSFIMSANVKLMVGQPIDLSPYFGREGDKAVLQEVTRLLLVEIAKLAGVANYDAKVAGRNWKTDQPDADDHSTESPGDTPQASDRPEGVSSANGQ